ncbi:MAG: T9SS type A sorting domain-containing protein [Bacteroidales bacterium]
MKKLYFSFAALFLGCLSLNAQVLYSDNFDTYTAGAKVAQTIGSSWWTTWSNAPGGAEDGIISNAQSLSPSNSIYISGSNDLIFKCGGKTTGRYELSWQMFVPSSHIGYFNLLHIFSGANSEWAFQAYIYNDSIYIDAAGAKAAGGQFVRNTWHAVKLIVDVDDDFATCFIDGNELISYQWSKGAFGDGTTNKLDAIDFYAWDGSHSPTPNTGGSIKGYYVDDLLYKQVTPPNEPTNLTATVNGADIDLNWTAPNPTPNNYILIKNGTIILNTTNNAYTDLGPWPNTYNYMVRAGYGTSGYSHPSNTATVTVTGGVTRNLVLYEGGTGTWCPYCPGAAMGLRDLIEVNSKNAVAIEYHYGDTYENMDATQRLGYYSIMNFPTIFADGKLKAEGGNATTSLYPIYLNFYNERINIPALQNLNVNIVNTGVDTYRATITVEEIYSYLTTGLKLHTALTESNIAQNWQNQTEVDYVCRKMYPDAAGTDLDFTQSTTQTVTIDFNTTGYVKNNCEFVVFVQHDASKEVTQVAKVDMSTIIGIEELSGNKISLYPNPTSNYIVLLSNGNGNLTITDITGKVVYNASVNQTQQYFNIANLSKGIYMVKYTSKNNSFTQKLLIE